MNSEFIVDRLTNETEVPSLALVTHCFILFNSLDICGDSYNSDICHHNYFTLILIFKYE